MKILTPGDIRRIDPEFKMHCYSCGCVFLVKRSECARKQGQYNETVWAHQCPCCKQQIYAYE